MTPRNRRRPAQALGLRIAVLAALGALAPAFGQASLVANSPFGAAAGAGGSAAAPAQAYELAGASVVGRDVLVCIVDRQAKHSEWIPVGGSVGAIRVLSYDQDRDRAVVTVSGERKELVLRKATTSGAAAQEPQFASMAVAPKPLPPVSSGTVEIPPEPAPANMSQQAREQMEARMLVSDLLEIGVQQRKAYQEARQKAAQAPAQPSN